MPIPQSQPAPIITPVVSFPTPRGRCDLAFYEVRRGLNPGNRLWTYGEKHPNSKLYPNHELVAVTPQDHEWERWYYAAERADQEKYNWEYTEQGEWETLTQLFLLKRCDFSTDTAGYPAPPTELFDSTDYVVTSLDESEINDDTLRSLYVTVRVRREKILNNPKVSVELDPQTNTLREIVVEKVPAGTAGSVVDLAGQYSEVRALNTRWALKTTQFMSGLAGNGDEAYQQWEDVINYSWPDVLDYVRFFDFPSSSGTTKSIGARPVWKRQRYDGPCAARITERWTKLPPDPPLITPMLPQEIEYNSPLLNVGIPPCLHDAFPIWHTPGTSHPSLGFYVYYEFYPATNFLDWPEIHIASFTVRPAMGGYLSRLVEVYRPDGTLFDNVLRLNAPTAGTAANSIVLNWTLSNQVGTLSQYRLDVCTDPEFTGTFLTGFNNKNVGTVTTYTVTGLTPGVQYFARVRATLTTPSATAESNPQLLVAPTVASYTVFVNPQLFDGDTIDYGPVNVSGTDVAKTLTINNTGNVALSLPSVVLDGPDAALWDVTGPTPTSVSVGGSSTVTLTFDPVSVGEYEATATLNFTNAAPMTLNLVAEAGTPTAEFELDSVPATSGATVNYDYSYSSSVIGVTNTGSGNLTITNIQLTGANPEQWSLSPAFFDPITVAPGDTTGIFVSYAPTFADSHSATLTISHDAAGSPFVLDLSGVATVAEIDFDWPAGTDQAPGGFGISFYAGSTETGTTLLTTLVIKAGPALLPITIPSLSISGAAASSFGIAGLSGAPTTSIEILPSTSFTYEVSYVAGAPGAYEVAQIDYTHDAPNHSTPDAITLEGYVASYY